MNAPLTHAADGLPRRSFTNADVLRMIDAGVIDPEESFELIKGEIVPMSPEFDKHFYARMTLVRRFVARLGAEHFIGTEGSLFLAEDIEFKPDLHVFPVSLLVENVRGSDVLLAVEIAWSSRNRDLHLKAPLYAEHGVRELWVFDLDARVTHVMRDPSAEGYRSHEELDGAASVQSLLVPGLAVALNDLLRA